MSAETPCIKFKPSLLETEVSKLFTNPYLDITFFAQSNGGSTFLPTTKNNCIFILVLRGQVKTILDTLEGQI